MNSVTRSSFRAGTGLAILLFFLTAGFCRAQQAGNAERKAAPATSKQKPSEPQKPPARGENQPDINQQFGEPLAAESSAAAGGRESAEAKESENAQEKMVEELKLSPSVRWMAEHLHISPYGGYWLGILFDFGVLALIIVVALKKNLPSVFRTRTKTIQRGIEEARRASDEANTRLADIEGRLAKLDAEVAAMRAAAEQEAASEEQRILTAAEQDKKRIVEAAEAEIAAAAKLARRDLKAYAADLAVTLAERRIRVDAATDQALVRGFVGQLGEADKSNGHPAGKDGE